MYILHLWPGPCCANIVMSVLERRAESLFSFDSFNFGNILLLEGSRPDSNVPQRCLHPNVKDHRGCGAWIGEDNREGELGSCLRCRDEVCLAFHGGKTQHKTVIVEKPRHEAIVIQRQQIWGGNMRPLPTPCIRIGPFFLICSGISQMPVVRL